MPLSVPEHLREQALARVAAYAEARRRQREQERQERAAELAGSVEELEAKLAACREDPGVYGEFLFGYAPARHHRIWLRLFQQAMRGELPGGRRKLLLLAPPASAKSHWLSFVFVPWLLGQRPNLRILFVTSSDDNALLYGGAVRDTLDSNDRHREVFPDPAARPNKRRGWSSNGYFLRGTPPGMNPAFRAIGMGAKVVGARADVLILDDPLDQESAESPVEQAKAADYFDKTLSTRLLPDGFALAIMTRWHEQDLAAHLIERDDWYVVRCPMLAEDPREDPDALPDPTLAENGGWRQPGDPLWPEQFPEAHIANERAVMTTAQWNIVYQQNVVGAGGDIFASEQWFRPLPEGFHTERDEHGRTLRERCYRISAWDLAYSERDTAAFTVGTLGALDEDDNLYILAVERGHWTDQEVKAAILRQIQLWRPHLVVIEEAAFKAEATRELVRWLLGQVSVRIKVLRPVQKKEVRARLTAARAEAGKLFVDREQPWYPAWRNEHLAFPRGKYADQVDSSSLLSEAALELRREAPVQRVARVRLLPAPGKRRPRRFLHIVGR